MSNKQKFNVKKDTIWKNWHFYLLITLLSFIFYGTTVKNKYAMDDDLVTTTYEYKEDGSKDLISRHPNVEKGIAGIPSIFKSHFAVNKKQSYAYRPVVTSVFAIEYQFFGSNPAVSHFFNVLFYALVIILVFRFIHIAYPNGGKWFAVLVALLFLIHPLHSEVVNNIKSRDELLCIAFGLGSLIQLLKYLDQRKTYYFIASCLLLLLSLLSKKTGLVFFPIFLLTAYFFRPIKFKKLLLYLGAIVAIFVVWRLTAKGLLADSVAREKQFFENPLYFADLFSDRIPMYFYSNFYYLKLLLFPFPFRYYYGFDQVRIATWSNPLVWLTLVFMVSLVLWVCMRYKKREIWAFGTLFFFIGIGGACNLLFPAVGIIAERFAFVASLGFCIVLAVLIMWLMKSDKKWRPLVGKFTLGALCLISLIIVLNRNPAWSSRQTLYETDMVHLESSAKSHSLIGQYYAANVKSLRSQLMTKQGQSDRGLIDDYNEQLLLTIHHFKRCVEIDTSYAVSYNNLGAMYFLYKADVDSSRMNFEKAVALEPTYVEANFNLGNTYIEECNRLRLFYRLLIQVEDSMIYCSTAPGDFIQKNNDLISSFAQFQKNLNNTLVAAGKKSPDAESFISNLTIAVEQLVTMSNLIEIYNGPEFEKALLREIDKFGDLAKEGLLMNLLTEKVYDNMSKTLFDNQVKGKYNRMQLTAHLRKSADSLEMEILEHIYKAIEYDSAYFPAYSKLSQYYMDNGNIRACVGLNQKALLVHKFQEKYQFHINIGNAYLRANEIQKSISSFELAVDGLQDHLKKVRSDDQVDRKIKRMQSAQLIGQITKICTSLVNLSEGLGDLVTAEKYKKLKKSM